MGLHSFACRVQWQVEGWPDAVVRCHVDYCAFMLLASQHVWAKEPNHHEHRDSIHISSLYKLLISLFIYLSLSSIISFDSIDQDRYVSRSVSLDLFAEFLISLPISLICKVKSIHFCRIPVFFAYFAKLALRADLVD